MKPSAKGKRKRYSEKWEPPRRLIFGFLRKSDGHLYEIIANEGAICEMVEEMLRNKLWVFNSVSIEIPSKPKGGRGKRGKA